MWAIVKGHDEIAATLIESGADISIESKVSFILSS
jgi:ankyrin repeat protein